MIKKDIFCMSDVENYRYNHIFDLKVYSRKLQIHKNLSNGSKSKSDIIFKNRNILENTFTLFH